jgi:hypothetical protein
MGATHHRHNLLNFSVLAHFYSTYLQSVKMRFLDELCPPAFLYALFLAINLGFDVADSAFVTAALKVVGGGIGILFLDILCKLDLGIISWVLIATPFVMTALSTSVAMGIGLDRYVMSKILT